jgi:hypothetical protein
MPPGGRSSNTRRMPREGSMHEDPCGTMVLDALVLLHGRRSWGRAVRAHRADASVGCLPAIVLGDDPTGHGRPPSRVLDSRPCGHHGVPALVAGLGVEGEEGPPLPLRDFRRPAKLRFPRRIGYVLGPSSGPPQTADGTRASHARNLPEPAVFRCGGVRGPDSASLSGKLARGVALH